MASVNFLKGSRTEFPLRHPAYRIKVQSTLRSQTGVLAASALVLGVAFIQKICMTAIAPTPPTTDFTACFGINLNSNSTHHRVAVPNWENVTVLSTVTGEWSSYLEHCHSITDSYPRWRNTKFTVSLTTRYASDVRRGCFYLFIAE